MTVAERIKNLRKALHLSQKEFAVRLSVGQSTVSEIENGGREFGAQILESVCRSWPEVSAEWLMRGQGPMFHPSPFDGSAPQLGENETLAIYGHRQPDPCQQQLEMARVTIQAQTETIRTQAQLITLLQSQGGAK